MGAEEAAEQDAAAGVGDAVASHAVGGAAVGVGDAVGGAAAGVGDPVASRGATARRRPAANAGAAAGRGGRARPKTGLLARVRAIAAETSSKANALKEGDLVMVTEAAPVSDWRGSKCVITKMCKKQAEVKCLSGAKEGITKKIKFDLLMKTEASDNVAVAASSLAANPDEVSGEDDADEHVSDNETRTSAGNGRKLAAMLLADPNEFSPME